MALPISRTILAAMALAVAAPFATAVGLKSLLASIEPPAIDSRASVLVVGHNGQLLRPFAIDDGRWRLAAEPSDVDPLYLRMLLAYEDAGFHGHHGVELKALARAAWQLVRNGRAVSGGSTLTMQVVRLLDGRSTRDPAGKLGQIVRALALERALGKDEILRLYLLHAPFGGNLEGVRSAALAYFGKEPKRLSPAEAALLVALPQSPEARRPDRSPEAARQARDRVLARAAQSGVISHREAVEAARQPVPTGRRPFPMLAAHAAWRAVQEAPDARTHRLTIRADVQRRLEDLARARAAALPDLATIAILAADHASGEILASVGAPDMFDEPRRGFIDMTQAVRSPGSALKPLIYGLAFELGLAHPETLIEDRPVSFAGYAPGNFETDYHGTVTIRRALQLSLNAPAVQMLEAVGPARLLARMRRAGTRPTLADQSPPGLAIGLGGLGVTLHDLVALYAAVARGGNAVPLAIGVGPTPAPADSARRVLEARAAWQVASILVGAPGPHASQPGTVAFKTGTSYGYRDAWAVGFDGRQVVGVWVGRPDGAPVPGLVGLDAAAPILFDAFARIGPRHPIARPPAGLLTAGTAELPPPLRRFGSGRRAAAGSQARPEIVFPPDGAQVDAGITAGDPMPLALKIRNGTPPFLWLIDGRPVARSAFGREASWQPPEPGFVEIMVIDSRNSAARARVFVE